MAESKRPAHRIAPNSFSVSVRLGKPRRPRAIWRRPTRRACLASLLLVAAIAVVPAHDAAQTRASAPTSSAVVGVVSGRVTDEAGRALAGVTIRLTCSRALAVVVTSDAGTYQMNAPGPSPCTASFAAMNFATVRRTHLNVGPGASLHLDVVLPLRVTADVVVTAERTFRNLADLDHPEESLVGIADAASEGAVTGRQIAERPVMRPGEVLESVPGVIISQHSGEGKANQYYLRGFNLDHGTDFATTVAGVPVNLPTHAHGQGYSDLNFLIPELVSSVQFRKGPYSAEDGDFSAAGAATINYVNSLDAPIVDASGGEQGWARVLAAASPRVGAGHLLAAIEIGHNDGPWVNPDDDRKVNGVVRFSAGSPRQAFSVTGMAYAARWNSTDQVPDRAIASGLISRFGAIDDTDGGRTHRVNVSADYQRSTGQTLTRATAYVSRYALNLFSDFTYALDDPEHGDQFEQADRRWVSGARVTHRRLATWHGVSFENAVGAQYRHDAIPTVGLYHTDAQTRLSTVREDAVDEQSLGVFAESSARWTPWLRTTSGLRVDGYRFDVSSNIPVNSGLTHAGLASPKLGVVLGPWKKTEIYGNAGEGYHSNDARGTTITVDPSTGAPADRVTPLVRARGAEVGLRTVAVPHVQSTLAVWRLDLASELVFVGDAGTTEASRPSSRYGVEWSNYAALRPWLTVDADLAWSHARFTDDDPAGRMIPGAAGTIVSAGVTVAPASRAFGSVRLRYFGPRPLIEDNSVRSDTTSLVNAQAGWRLTSRVALVLDAFNVLNAAASDIDYFYTSRLPGEPLEGVDDIHTHPTLPRTLRGSVRVRF